MYGGKSIRYVEDENGCWICFSHKARVNGRIVTGRGGKLQTMSRYIYQKLVGDVPSHMQVCHSCDNPDCINPAHLWLGTIQDNMLDRDKKSRQAKGESNGYSKLTESQVIAIRNDTRLQRVVAKEYGVSRMQISRIKKGLQWKYLLKEVR